MHRKNYSGIVFLLFIILVISGIIISSKISKVRLRNSIESERQIAASAIEENLPIMIVNSNDLISEASATVELSSYKHEYKNYEGKPASYIQWEDNITLRCEADESFNKKTDSYKLDFFKKITSQIKEEAARIQADVAPVYDEYYSRSEIVNVFEEGVFCQRNVELKLTAGEDEYTYHGYSWHISEAFERNGKEIDLAPRSYSNSGTSNSSYKSNTTNSYSSGKKKNTGNNTYSREYPDCDDYEDWEEFMDDWDGEIPDGSDASDYWDNW